MASSSSRPRNYFLNESHELSPGEKSGGGRQVEYKNISWPQKAERLRGALQRVVDRTTQSGDPLRERKYYLMAAPVSEIVKGSTAKDPVKGEKREKVAFNGEQSIVFERIGLDLIEVHPNGAATVHATPERMNQLLAKTAQLPELGRQEQARFVTFDTFDWLAGKWKFDEQWLHEIGSKPAEGYIQLQPLIGELEADLVIRVLERTVRDFAGLALRGKGRSYLGRYFLRANLTASWCGSWRTNLRLFSRFILRSGRLQKACRQRFDPWRRLCLLYRRPRYARCLVLGWWIRPFL